MTLFQLRLLRTICVILAGACAFASYNSYSSTSRSAAPGSSFEGTAHSKRLEAALAALSALAPLALLAFFGAIGTLTKAIKEAEDEPVSGAERNRLEFEAAQRQRIENEEAARRAEWGRPHRFLEAGTEEERKRIVGIARSTYPHYIDEDELEAHGWRDESFRYDDPIAALLDPPEIVIKYSHFDTEDSELRLYLRERVNRLERHEKVKAYRDRVSEHRIRQRAKEWQEEREREAEEQERRLRQEAAERLKQQKVVRLDDAATPAPPRLPSRPDSPS